MTRGEARAAAARAWAEVRGIALGREPPKAIVRAARLFGLVRGPGSALALGVVGLYAVVAILVATGLVAAHPEARVGAKFLGSGPGHWLGTDRLGRDILARTLHGAKVALSVGGATAAVSVCFGSALGLLAGWYRGVVDALVLGLCSVVQSVPSILLLVALTYGFGRGLEGIVFAFSLTFWVPACRVMRAEVLRLRETELVDAARVLGFGTPRILFLHVLPNTLHVVLVNASLIFVSAIKAEVIISYLGLGVSGQPSWGAMIQQARAELINGFFWQVGAASIALFVLVLAFNVLADALQDAVDPRSAP